VLDFDARLLACIQFAFTVSAHIILPAFSIGLGISFVPSMVPHAVTIHDAAALVPAILACTTHACRVFRGKVKAVGGHHCWRRAAACRAVCSGSPRSGPRVSRALASLASPSRRCCDDHPFQP
jgi:hypothetical protein